MFVNLHYTWELLVMEIVIVCEFVTHKNLIDGELEMHANLLNMRVIWKDEFVTHKNYLSDGDCNCL
jgi:hypothetical protein